MGHLLNYNKNKLGQPSGPLQSFIEQLSNRANQQSIKTVEDPYKAVTETLGGMVRSSLPPMPQASLSQGRLQTENAKEIQGWLGDNLGFAGMTLFHGSPNPNLLNINPKEGSYGGLFGSPNAGAANSHGANMYQLDFPDDKLLTQYALDYEMDPKKVRKVIKSELMKYKNSEADEVWDMVVGDAGVHNSDMPEERIKEIFRAFDLGEASIEAQRVRGAIAKRLGFDAIEMADEHGTSYLINNANIKKLP